jgi:hypothetical protein
MLLTTPLVFITLISPAASALADCANTPLPFKATQAIFTPKK